METLMIFTMLIGGTAALLQFALIINGMMNTSRAVPLLSGLHNNKPAGWIDRWSLWQLGILFLWIPLSKMDWIQALIPNLPDYRNIDDYGNIAGTAFYLVLPLVIGLALALSPAVTHKNKNV